MEFKHAWLAMLVVLVVMVVWPLNALHVELANIYQTVLVWPVTVPAWLVQIQAPLAHPAKIYFTTPSVTQPVLLDFTKPLLILRSLV
jgi:hypothetical protein